MVAVLGFASSRRRRLRAAQADRSSDHP